MRPVNVLVKDIGDVLVLVAAGPATLLIGAGCDIAAAEDELVIVLVLFAVGPATLLIGAGCENAATDDELVSGFDEDDVVGSAVACVIGFVLGEEAVVMVEFAKCALVGKAALLVEPPDVEAGVVLDDGFPVAVADPEMLG
jgi:hypothetical protein